LGDTSEETKSMEEYPTYFDDWIQ